MKNNQNQIIITFALPYGNGELHIGHLYEAFLVDIQAKALKSQGKDVLTISATDAHGTPISLSANKQNISESDYVLSIHEKQKLTLYKFEVLPSIFDTTNSNTNKINTELTYLKAVEKKHIQELNKNIPYDPISNVALFERLIIGTCPNCGNENVKGNDACSKCQNIYNGQELLNPISALSGEKPIYKDTPILYFGKKESFFNIIKQNKNIFSIESLNKINEWLKNNENDSGLEISRPNPYWGFNIPNTNLSFAVWWDAPLGYLSSIQEYDHIHGTSFFKHYSNGLIPLINYIGKDILRFHAFYWLLQLEVLELPFPNKIITHGFICGEDGKKLSKSEGNYISIDQLLEKYPVASIKLFFALNTPKNASDLCFSEKQIKELWNNIIVGKFSNIAFRCSALIEKNYNGILLDTLKDSFQIAIKNSLNDTISYIANGNLQEGTKKFIDTLSKIDQTISSAEPWKDINVHNQYILSLAINSLYQTIDIIGLFSSDLKEKLYHFYNQEKIAKPKKSWATRI